MGLMECKECGGMLGRKAKACPSCGSPRGGRTSLGTWAVLALILLVLPGVLDRPHDDRPDERRMQARSDSSRSSAEHAAIRLVKDSMTWDCGYGSGPFRTGPLKGGIAVTAGGSAAYSVSGRLVFPANGIALGCSPSLDYSPLGFGFSEISQAAVR